MPNLEVKIIDWNVGGAKYLELPSWNGRGPSSDHWEPGDPVENRQQYKRALMGALHHLVVAYHPHVIALQEIVQFSKTGDPSKREELLDAIDGYAYQPCPLIDTEHYSARRKWARVIKAGGWRKDPGSPEPFFAQGNGFLVRDDCQHFSFWSLPKAGIEHRDHPENRSLSGEHRIHVEKVDLQTGLYFGDRNTEPRVALMLHLVLWPSSGKPLDVFMVNLHLTTLHGEREGIPEVDERASGQRLRQLEVVLDGIVSRYNQWRGGDYGLVVSDSEVSSSDTRLAKERHNPIWVIAGDFNFTRQSAEYQYLTRRNFMDLLQGDDPTKSSGLGKNPTLVVDYVFAGPRFYAFDPQLAELGLKHNRVVVDNYVRVSDHYPIVADVPILVSG